MDSFRLPGDLCDGAQEVELTFQNQQKNSVLNPRCSIEVVGAGAVESQPERTASNEKTYYLRKPRTTD